MWSFLKGELDNQREMAMVAAFIAAALTQALAFYAHKLGLSAELLAMIPGAANTLTAAFIAGAGVYVMAHAHAEHGSNVGDGVSDAVSAAGKVIEGAVEKSVSKAMSGALGGDPPSGSSSPPGA